MNPIEPTKLLRWRQVAELTGVSRTTLWRWERKGKFPSRRMLGPSTVRWRSDEVQEWIDSRKAVGQ